MTSIYIPGYILCSKLLRKKRVVTIVIVTELDRERRHMTLSTLDDKIRIWFYFYKISLQNDNVENDEVFLMVV